MDVWPCGRKIPLDPLLEGRGTPSKQAISPRWYLLVKIVVFVERADRQSVAVLSARCFEGIVFFSVWRAVWMTTGKNIGGVGSGLVWGCGAGVILGIGSGGPCGPLRGCRG